MTSDKSKKFTLVHSSDEDRTNERIRVLLVDDQLIVAEGIRRMLDHEADIDFIYCNEPEKALAIAIEKHVTVVLMDLLMPEIDGTTLTRYFRSNKLTQDIPILMMSSKEDPVTKKDAFTCGANDYLVKLPDKIELVARIRAHSNQYRLKIERDQAYIELYKVKKELEESNRLLHKLSSLDGLTQVANRRRFDETLEKSWQAAIREKRELSLLLIDIDHFKKFNDSFGHQTGDTALIEVAQALANTIQRSDDSFFRYGGEEFAVILPATSRQGAEQVASKCHEIVATLNLDTGEPGMLQKITLSIGCTTLVPSKELDKNLLVRIADRALYTAKENGRNCTVYLENLK